VVRGSYPVKSLLYEEPSAKVTVMSLFPSKRLLTVIIDDSLR